MGVPEEGGWRQDHKYAFRVPGNGGERELLPLLSVALVGGEGWSWRLAAGRVWVVLVPVGTKGRSRTEAVCGLARGTSMTQASKGVSGGPVESCRPHGGRCLGLRLPRRLLPPAHPPRRGEAATVELLPLVALVCPSKAGELQICFIFLLLFFDLF